MSSTSPLTTIPVTVSKEIKLVCHDFFLTNSCGSSYLSSAMKQLEVEPLLCTLGIADHLEDIYFNSFFSSFLFTYLF